MQHHKSFRWLQQEGYLIQDSLAAGLTAMRGANDSDRGRYYATLFQLSIGVERLMKVIFYVSHLVQNDFKPPNSKQMRKFGHGLVGLHEHLKKVTDLDDGHWGSPPPVGPFAERILQILNDFAKTTRYANLDSLTGSEVPDPLEDYQELVAEVLFADVRPERIAALAGSRLLLADEVAASCGVAVDPGSPWLSSQELMRRKFVGPVLQDEGAKHVVWHTMALLHSLRRRLYATCSEAHDVQLASGQREISIPYMDEFLQFIIVERRRVMKKKRWP